MVLMVAAQFLALLHLLVVAVEAVTAQQQTVKLAVQAEAVQL
jgi:hypothetical protein